MKIAIDLDETTVAALNALTTVVEREMHDEPDAPLSAARRWVLQALIEAELEERGYLALVRDRRVLTEQAHAVEPLAWPSEDSR